MKREEFFDIIHEHFTKALPFVAYRKPNEIEIKALLQNDNTIHEVNDFSESGFVFAPFDDSEKSIVMPLNASRSIKMDFDMSISSNISHQDIKYNEANKIEHISLVQKGIDSITDNAFQKVVLSRCEIVNLSENNPITIFKRLLNNYPAAFVYCWYHPKFGLWLGATPETLTQVSGKRFKTMALAGTQKYNGSLEVHWQDKEKQEQAFVTDYIVDNLKTSIETLSVSKPITVRAGNLLHIKTAISGTLKSDLNAVLQKLHPTPAVCGLPKESTKHFILKEENYNREFYTGFLGELNFQEKQMRNTNTRNVENNAYVTIKTNSHLFVNLRCMQLKESQAIIYIGGGITKESVAEDEWDETVNKSLTIKAVLD